ncbi:MAG TPA: AAA family ATPase, partial [Candidatus Polarisedimenticolia bacterium]|nr:AAA family ATPase [Candidatus Polarisedimenticolia bacterium]
VGCTVGVFASATVFSLMRPKLYEATSTLLLSRQRVQAIDMQDLYTKNTPGTRPNEVVAAQIEILKSTSVLESAVRDLEQRGLLHFDQPDEGDRPPLLQRVLIAAHVRQPDPPPTPDARRRGYIRDLSDRMSAGTRGGNAFLAVSVQSRSPEMAAETANAITSAYLRNTRELMRRSADDAVEWLSGKLREQRDKLLEAEERLRGISGNTPQADEMDRLSVQEMSRIQAALLDVRLMMLRAETGGPTPGPGGTGAGSSPPGNGSVDDAVNSALRDKVQQELVDTVSTLQRLRRTYGENHPDVLAAAEKEKSLRADLERLEALAPRPRTGEAANRLSSADTQALKAQERLLQQQLDGVLHSSSAKGEAAMKYAIAKKEVEINRSLYNEMLTRLNEITIAAGLDPGSAETFETARIPRAPFSPQHTQTILLGLAAGLLLGFAAAALRDHLDQSLRDPGQANDLLRAPVLGIIPDHRSIVGRPVPRKGTRLYVGHGEETVSAEAYRVLRSHIEGTLTPDESRILILTSAVAGEGKSTTAANLAAAFAESGRRVLLIDADFRRPTLRKVLGVELPEDHQLALVLSGMKAPEKAIVDSGVPDLDFIGHRVNGKIPDGSKTTESFKKLFAWGRDRYDRIIVDLPVLMVAPGVTELGRAGGTVLLVHRPGWVPAPVLDQVRQHLAMARTRLLGAILNGTGVRWAASQYLPVYYHAAYYSRKTEAP